MKKAIVIGSTGLVGTQLVNLLMNNENFTEIISFVRRSSGVSHPKLTEHIVNFDNPDEWKELVKGDVLFSAMGTTLAKAKTKDFQYKVDFTYQYETAKAAFENGVPCYVLVSSAGANPDSINFYLNMKGKLEKEINRLPFKSTQIFRPGQLDGNRKEKRLGEKLALKLTYFANKLGLFNKYRPIQGSELAKAMIAASEKPQSGIYTLNQIFDLI